MKRLLYWPRPRANRRNLYIFSKIKKKKRNLADGIRDIVPGRLSGVFPGGICGIISEGVVFEEIFWVILNS